jgi:hypothetical protein
MSVACGLDLHRGRIPFRRLGGRDRRGVAGSDYTTGSVACDAGCNASVSMHS